MEQQKESENEEIIELLKKIKNLEKDKMKVAKKLKNIQENRDRMIYQFEKIEEAKSAREKKYEGLDLINYVKKIKLLEENLQLLAEKNLKMEEELSNLYLKYNTDRKSVLHALIKKAELLQKNLDSKGMKLANYEKLKKEIDEINKTIEFIR